jgi:hypothetical protein
MANSNPQTDEKGICPIVILELSGSNIWDNYIKCIPEMYYIKAMYCE